MSEIKPGLRPFAALRLLDALPARRVFAGIFLCGLALRWLLALRLGDGVYQPDEGVYISLAKNLAAFKVLGSGMEPSAAHPPLLPVFMAAALSVAGPSVLAARLAHAAMGALLPVLVYGYGREWLGEKTGRRAGLAACAYPFFVYWSGIMMTETLTAVLVVAALWGTHRLLSGGRPSAAAGVGLLWGLAALSRMQNLPMAPYAALCILAAAGWRSGWRRAAALLAASALPVALWAARNNAEFGSPALDTHSGTTLIIRTMFYESDVQDTGLAMRALKESALYAEASKLPEHERDALFRAAAIRHIREDPATYARHCFGNFIQLWRFYPRMDKTVGVFDSAFLGGRRSWFVVVSLLTEPLLICFGVLGLWLCRRGGVRTALPVGFIVLTTAVHTLVIAQMRYRVVAMPIVILLAAAAVTRLVEREP